jgi:hypothetical protein
MKKTRFLNTNRYFYYKRLDFRNYHLNISGSNKITVLIKYIYMYVRIYLGYKKIPFWIFEKDPILLSLKYVNTKNDGSRT